MSSPTIIRKLCPAVSPGLTVVEQRWWQAILENDVTTLCELRHEVRLDQVQDIDVINEINSWRLVEVTLPQVVTISPLHLATVCGSENVVRFLINNGADIESDLDGGDTALHLACIYGQAESVKILIQSNCDVNYQTSGNPGGGDSPLMLTVACYRIHGMTDMYLDIARCLLEAGCDVNLTDHQGLTPLHLAAGKEDSTMLKLLIKHGADIDVKLPRSAKTPLLCAVSAGLEDNVRLLLSAGCQVNSIACQPDNTALSVALSHGSLSMILDLLEAGADPRICPDTLDIQMYLNNKHYVVIILLLAYGLDINWQSAYDKASLLIKVTRNQCVYLVKLLLLQVGSDCELETKLGTTPLWAAVKCNHVGLVRIFILWNCDTDILSLEYNPIIPISPIQLALINGNRDIAQILLHYGCKLKKCWLKNEPLVSRLNERPLIKRWLHDSLCEVKSLRHTCMVVIRRSIGPGLPVKIRKLQLPAALKKYIITGSMS